MAGRKKNSFCGKAFQPNVILACVCVCVCASVLQRSVKENKKRVELYGQTSTEPPETSVYKVADKVTLPSFLLFVLFAVGELPFRFRCFPFPFPALSAQNIFMPRLLKW